jgi:bla regulator protein BlaR1
MKKLIKPLKNEKIENIYNKILSDMYIGKKPLLGISDKVTSPITLGIFKPYIILPSDTIHEFSNDEIKYILLHELTHYKNKDILINYIVCLFQVLYWFNPITWFLFKELKTDMEIACDIDVLKILNESNYIDYGKTIINFASKISELPTLSTSSGISGSKQQIKKRIQKISAFTAENKTFILKSSFIYLILGLFILTQIPLISAVSANDKSIYDFKESQVTYEDLSYYFHDLSGSFVLYDLNSKQYSIYNKKKSVLRVSPNSTYKIFSGLLGLEKGVIGSELNTLYWNGTNYPYDAWNRDQNLNSAMQSSVNWYFQDIDKQVGIKELQNYFKKINYGNYDLSSGINDYWIESSLKVSPIEQVQLLKSFYLNEFNFKAENIKAIKNAIKISDKNTATMYGKTGTGTVGNKNINGWFIGFIEKNDNTYFFATNIQASDNANGSTAAEITQKILKEKNIY